MNVPIRLYFHCCMINHWQEIVKDLFKAITESGLYDACENISIGTLGDINEHRKAMDLLKDYSKVRFVEHSENLGRSELHTLNHLKNDADKLPKFYAYYFHTKGVSYAREQSENNYQNGVWWRKLMTHFIIKDWKRSYRALDLKDLGYDVSGCKGIQARISVSKKSHYAGNFWCANSEYIRTLNPITNFVGHHLHAEMWLFENTPFAYILCNAYTVGVPFDKNFEEEINNLTLSEYTI